MTVFIAGGVVDESREAFEADATVEVMATFKNKITEHPIESGASIVDHVFNQNAEIEVTAVVSNTPVAQSGIKNRKNLIGSNNVVYDSARTKRAYDILKDWYKTRKLITIVTDLDSYRNCVMTDLKIPRSAEWSESAQFKMTFTQVRITGTQTSLFLVAEPIRDNSEEEKKSEGSQRTYTLRSGEVILLDDIGDDPTRIN